VRDLASGEFIAQQRKRRPGSVEPRIRFIMLTLAMSFESPRAVLVDLQTPAASMRAFFGRSAAPTTSARRRSAVWMTQGAPLQDWLPEGRLRQSDDGWSRD